MAKTFGSLNVTDFPIYVQGGDFGKKRDGFGRVQPLMLRKDCKSTLTTPGRFHIRSNISHTHTHTFITISSKHNFLFD